MNEDEPDGDPDHVGGPRPDIDTGRLRAERDALQSRLQSLKETVDDLRGAVTKRDQRIAGLEQQLAELDERTRVATTVSSTPSSTRPARTTAAGSWWLAATSLWRDSTPHVVGAHRRRSSGGPSGGVNDHPRRRLRIKFASFLRSQDRVLFVFSSASTAPASALVATRSRLARHV
jgi:hypothetical protein